MVRDLLQLADDGVDGGEVVEPESAQVVGCRDCAQPCRRDRTARTVPEIRHIGPNPMLLPVVRLTCDRVYVMVRRRKGEACR